MGVRPKTSPAFSLYHKRLDTHVGHPSDAPPPSRPRPPQLYPLALPQYSVTRPSVLECVRVRVCMPGCNTLTGMIKKGPRQLCRLNAVPFVILAAA